MIGPLDTRRASLMLVAVSLLILLSGTAALPLLDRDEPRFARATVEMLDRGDWVVPYFNDGYRFDKPPLTYWLMAVGYQLFGINELGARAHSVLAATLTTLLLFLFGRRLFSSRVGFAAAFAWATCFQVFLHGRLALADAPMVLAVLVSEWALYELLFGCRAGEARRWFWILWLSLAIGFLAKGPIALIVPALTLLFTRLFVGRRGLRWRRLGAPLGVPVMLAVIGAWGIPALLRTDGQFWDVGIGEHIVRRGIVAFNDRPIIPFYYLLTVLISLFPWSPNLGQGFVELRRNWRDDKNKFLLAWILGPILVFSFYSTQLPHYTLPAFPALLLLIFRSGANPARFPRWSRRFYYGLHAFFFALLVALSVILATRDLPPQHAPLLWPLFGLVAVLLGLQAIALSIGLRARRSPDSLLAGAVVPVTVGLLVVMTGTWLVATWVRPLTIPIRLRDRFETMPPHTRFVAHGYTEPSLVFYADATWDFDNQQASGELIAEPGPLLVLYRIGERGLDGLLLRPSEPDAAADIPDAAPEINAMAARAGVPRTLIDSSLERELIVGFNFARSSWTELIVFYRE